MIAAGREIRIVAWVDSTATPGWVHLSEVAKTEPGKIVTVGFVMREDDEFVVLAPSLDLTNENACDLIAIPRFAIVEGGHG